MKVRSLHTLFSRIVLLALPIGTHAACGGASIGEGVGGSDTGGSGGTDGSTGGTAATTGGNPNCRVPKADSSRSCTLPYSGQVPASCISLPLDTAKCMAICDRVYADQCSVVSEDATHAMVTVQCPPTCVAGRRPSGFVPTPLPASGLGGHFARATELEAASVFAFRGLRAELRALGAPRRLLRALSRAARDEQRHTRATRSLARRFGASPTSLTVRGTAPRGVETIAAENVMEGCVRELYGALVATFQAEHARDLRMKAVLARIAREETRHAALSLALERWLNERLDPSARMRVEAARSRAITTLRQEIEAQGSPADSELAGLPSTAQSLRLFDELRNVWNGSANSRAARRRLHRRS